MPKLPGILGVGADHERLVQQGTRHPPSRGAPQGLHVEIVIAAHGDLGSHGFAAGREIITFIVIAIIIIIKCKNS